MVPGLQFVFPGPLFPHAPQDMIAALGKNGQFIDVVPSQKIVLIRIGNMPGTSEIALTFNDTIWQKLNEVICNNASIGNSLTVNPVPEIYPNPVSETFTIDWLRHRFDVAVFDHYGRLVIKQNNVSEHTRINCRAWVRGLYVVRVNDYLGEVYVRKMVVSW